MRSSQSAVPDGVYDDSLPTGPDPSPRCRSIHRREDDSAGVIDIGNRFRYRRGRPPVRTQTISIAMGIFQVEFTMATGTVAFFHERKGYGFIETDEADEDVFFHMEDVGGPDLEEGQEVEFDIREADKGPRAENVTRL